MRAAAEFLLARGGTVVVSGASSGIGASVAELLRRAAVSVVALDIRPPEVDGIDCVSVDLADPASIDRAVASLPSVIDGLVNAAGLPGSRRDEDVFAVNFLGLRHLTEELLPKVRPGGAVVHVASTAASQWATRLPLIRSLLATTSFAEGRDWFAVHRPPGVAAYNFSKEAVCVYAMGSAQRAVEQGIRVNAVSPGPVSTPILPDFIATMGADRIEWARGLAGRYGEPADIAEVIAFLLSDQARWINGTNVVADGGVTGAVLSGTAQAPSVGEERTRSVGQQ